MSAEPIPGNANPYAQLIAKSWNSALPMTALWEITYACNHKCAFCYNCPERGRRELTREQITDGLRKIADLGCVFLVLSGGEPLTRPDFFDIAWAGKRLGFALRIYTNGYLIDEIVARKLKDLMPFEIEISFHGSNPFTLTPGSTTEVNFSLARKIAEPAVEAEFGIQFATSEIPDLLTVGKIRARLERG